MPSMPLKVRRTSGGVERDSYEVTIALIPSDDFGEIIDTRPPATDIQARWAAKPSKLIRAVTNLINPRKPELK